MESMEVDSNENQLPRSRLVVDQKLQDAKLEPTNFLPTAQCVFFNDDLDNDGVRLLELDGDLLRDLEAGKAHNSRLTMGCSQSTSSTAEADAAVTLEAPPNTPAESEKSASKRESSKASARRPRRPGGR